MVFLNLKTIQHDAEAIFKTLRNKWKKKGWSVRPINLQQMSFIEKLFKKLKGETSKDLKLNQSFFLFIFLLYNHWASSF